MACETGSDVISDNEVLQLLMLWVVYSESSRVSRGSLEFFVRRLCCWGVCGVFVWLILCALCSRRNVAFVGICPDEIRSLESGVRKLFPLRYLVISRWNENGSRGIWQFEFVVPFFVGLGYSSSRLRIWKVECERYAVENCWWIQVGIECCAREQGGYFWC